MNAVVDFSFVHDLVADLYHEDNGRPAYNPEVLLRLIFLQLQYKLSDRAVIDRAQTDHAFRLFLGLDWDDELPHPTSLTKFRQRLGEERFKAVFHGFLRQALERKLVSNKRLLIDSFNVQADIAVPGFRTLLDRIISRALRSLEASGMDVTALREGHASLREDKSYQLGTEFRKQLLEEWLALAELVAEALEELERPTVAQAEALELLNDALERWENHGKRNVKKDDLLSDVDPDARWGRKKRGKQVQAGYSEQLAVDAEYGIVTHVEVVPGNTDDSEMLVAVVEGHQESVGDAPREVVADSKYQSGENRAYLQDRGIEDHIAAPTPKGSKQGKFSVSDFAVEFDSEGVPTVALCPAGQISECPRWRKATHAWVFQFTKAQCEGCPLRERCSKQKRGRQLSVDRHYPLTEKARVQQAGAAGEEAQIARLGIERQFAYQQRQGGRRTRYRGLTKNRMWGWAWGMYLNITRMAKLLWQPVVSAAVWEGSDKERTARYPGGSVAVC
ncbi:MAG: IS1182 family transposase [Armatimonadetes bacterium]|nr:IS1182 family transposase [Armatimonadota bacterium]